MSYIDRRPRMLNTAAKSRKLHRHVSCIGSQGLSPCWGFLILQGLSPCHRFLILQDLRPC